MNVEDALREANSILPGKGGEGDDARWQAIIRVGEHIQTDSEAIWTFVERWGSHPNEDVRDAIATVLLEHLFEHHFDAVFPNVERSVQDNPLFADTFCRCWKLGESEKSDNAAAFDRLQERAGRLSK